MYIYIIVNNTYTVSAKPRKFKWANEYIKFFFQRIKRIISSKFLSQRNNNNNLSSDGSIMWELQTGRNLVAESNRPIQQLIGGFRGNHRLRKAIAIHAIFQSPAWPKKHYYCLEISCEEGVLSQKGGEHRL